MDYFHQRIASHAWSAVKLDLVIEFLDTDTHRVHYLRRPFERRGVTTDFNGASVNFPFAELLARAEEPA